MTARPFLAFLLMASFAAAPGVEARDQEWVLRIQNDAKNLSISVGQTTVVGNAANRVKGSGRLVEKARSVGSFSRIRLDGPVDLRLVQAGSEGVRVSADDNIEPMISTVVEGDTLVVGVKSGSSFSTHRDLHVAVDFKELQALEIRGSGDVRLDRLKTDRFRLDMSGSGDMAIALLEAREFSAVLSGSGDLSLAGQADQQDFTLSGSGDVAAESMAGRVVRARLSGSGDLRLGVGQELDATLSGSGDLSYAGRPKVKSRVSGSGELIAR